MQEYETQGVIDKAKDTVSVWEFQQDTAELASIVHYLHDHGGVNRYLEIGAGSGMVAHTLNGLFQFDIMHVIDNNYYDFAQRDRKGRLPDAIEWVGDSTSAECREAVESWGVEFDFIIVDGAHDYDSVKSDVELAVSCIADGGFIAVHDKGWPGECDYLAEVASGAIPGLTETEWVSANTALYQYEENNA